MVRKEVGPALSSIFRNGKLYSDCPPWGRFGYEDGTLQYIGGQKTVIEDVENDCWSIFEAYAELRQFGYTRENISALWYKDPASQWLEKALKLFVTDKDALKMCRIANLRSHVEVFVVHVVEDAEEFSEVGFIDVGGQTKENPGNQLVVYEGEKGQEVENDDVQQGNEGDKLKTDVAAENEWAETNIDDDSDDEEFIPSDLEVDSAGDIHFTDSDEEYDDESGFEEDTSAKNSKRVDKGKGVMNGDFSDEKGFNSDEVDLEYEVGVDSDDEEGQGEDNNETRSYPIHKDCKDMSSYKWEVGTIFASREEFKDTVTSYVVQTIRGLRYAKLELVRVRAVCQPGCLFWLYAAKMKEEVTWQLRSMNLKHTCGQLHRIGIMHTLWLSRVFKNKVEHNPKVKIKELVNNAQRKWNLTVTTSMAARSWQAALDDIQGEYRKQYKRIANYCSELLRANPGSSMTLKTHLSRREKIQRCSNCGASGHKRGRCSNSPLLAQPLKQSAVKKKTNGGRKRSISQPAVHSATRGRKRSKPQEKSSSQPQPATSSTPITRSKSSHSQPISKPTTHASKPKTTPAATPQRRPKMKPIKSSTQPPPATKEKGASSSSQPVMNKVSFTHNIALHVSPRKLRLMAKLPPRD
ncbi:hypothetical protein Ahy_A03g014752 [Arachis hypogaea]|uniref:PB1-like domain-containing protein n=1 Tax=Arachis hypogaea TaxID=3818 RepID=A0A445DYP8_ARAHY|nr:hypothetical protein Ahy_A03g014752 [Arachis hypogaea]